MRYPKTRQEEKSITTLTGISQKTNVSPLLNTHYSINRNYIAITGATQTTNISPQLETLKHSLFNRSNKSIKIIL